MDREHHPTSARTGRKKIEPGPQSPRWLRIGVVIGVVVLLNLAGSWIAAQLNVQIWPRHSYMIDFITLASVAVYMVAMALPFVPGIEIGLGLMLVLGRGAILPIYLCTQVSLALSFLLGRLVPVTVIVRFLGWLRLVRARRLLEELEQLEPAHRLDHLLSRTSNRWTNAMLRYRYLALGLVLNLPGNAIIGGAGGIGMIAGMSRMFRFSGYVLLVAVATTPVPVLLLLGGAVVASAGTLGGPPQPPSGGGGSLARLTAGSMIAAPQRYPIPVFGRGVENHGHGAGAIEVEVEVDNPKQARQAFNHIVESGASAIKFPLEPDGPPGAPWSMHPASEPPPWPIPPLDVVKAVVEQTHGRDRKVSAAPLMCGGQGGEHQAFEAHWGLLQAVGNPKAQGRTLDQPAQEGD